MIKSKKTSSILLAVMLFSLFFAGCNEKSKELSGKAETDTSAITQSEDILPSDVIVDDSVLYSLFSDIDNLMFEGNTNTANKLFLGAMEKEEFKELKEPLFNAMIRFFISTEQFKLAEEQYLSALRTMPEIAEPGFDTIYGAYLNAGDEEGALTWARILATQDIGEGLRLTADDWLINSLYRTAKYEEMAEVITEKIGIYETPKFASMVEMLGRRAVGEGNITVAEQVVDAIGMSGKKDQPDFARVMTSLGIYIDSGKGNWTEIASRMPELVSMLPDTQLLPAIRQALRTAAKEGKVDMVDAMAGALLESDNAAKVPQTRFACAREWVSNVFRPGATGAGAYPERFEKLMQIGLPAEQLFTIFANNFYNTLSDNSVTESNLLLGEKLLPQLTDDAKQESMRLYILDLSFMVDDYDRALQLLEKGFSIHDENWHAMSIAKVRAHKAQKDGDYAAAVKHYRDFMGLLGEDDIIDPVTSITFSYSTLMGNNEKRIGDLWTEAGMAGEAAKAYAAANEWYVKALEGNKAGKETEEYINEQRALLPSGKETTDQESENNGPDEPETLIL
ncbi:MAG: hypothetical protein GX804_07740 [Lentisphaerae bacterium]|jgi:tetratricopeptide (TPR) repeat protein|nr:hypothetical protein [Lentisphaerota bacterium]